MRPNIAIEVEFLAGTDIKDACREAVEMGLRLRCHVRFNFNGVSMFAAYRTDPDQLADRYRQDIVKPESKET